MTYHKVSIHKLSHAQLLKLLRGHRVRVKHGHGHEIHVSEEQHKKIMNAHKKGCGTTLQFDPYQIDMHKGQMPATPFLYARQGHGEGIHHEHGEGFFDMIRSVGKTVAPALIDVGANALKNGIAGLGIRRSRSKKAGHGEGLHHHKKSHSLGGALNPAGYGAGRARRRKGHGIRSNISDLA
jgi:hypothetical protein